MNSTKRNLLLSVLTIALCLVLVVGATFALYQSEASTNVEVTSGKVNVKASFSRPELYNEIEEGDRKSGWLSGKVVQKGDNLGKYDLIAMAPYEGFTFDVTVVNNSTINVKWQMQIVIDCDDKDFLKYFEVGFEGGLQESESDGNTFVSNWESLDVADGENVSTPYTADVKLKANAPVDDKSRRLSITVTIIAIQANATTEDGARA